MPALSIEEYHVGWICALKTEMAAAKAMLDEEHNRIGGQDAQDYNTYVLGRIHKHNIVIACLPAGVDGTTAAATVAKDMARTFTAIRFCLLVGIGGGIPDVDRDIDIRLGDVVVSQPVGKTGGVVQYDKGKSLEGGDFLLKGMLNLPPTTLLTALNLIQAEHEATDSQMMTYVTDMLKRYPKMAKNGYGYPGAAKDRLFQAQHAHPVNQNTCAECDKQWQVSRPDRIDTDPQIHYGLIASGNQVVKDAAVRDRLRGEYGAFCVEMEAAGLMNDFPCLVIRGICDYADSHKNDIWHRYAASAAAAYAKELLSYVSIAQARSEKPIEQVIDLVQQHVRTVVEQNDRQEAHYQDDRYADCHRAFKTSPYELQKNFNPDRVQGTCQWLLDHQKFHDWLKTDQNDLLWISADPGCGKSVLAKSLIDIELRDLKTYTICYFFFKDNEEQDKLATALCALLHQLFDDQPSLIKHALSSWTINGKQITREVDEMWRILLSAAMDAQARNVICVLDALDECRNEDRSPLISRLSHFYATSRPKDTSEGCLKFLVTSRPYDDIQTNFQEIPPSLPSIRLKGEDKTDQIHHEINLVIRKRVAMLAQEQSLDDATKDKLESKLLGMEHQTYLWLYLAMEGIYSTYRNSLRPADELIESLPSGVEEAYEQILAKITATQQDNVRKILTIVVGARRPLKVSEMATALGIAISHKLNTDQNPALDELRVATHIRQWCGLFITFNHSTIHLIHQTAKEFLLRRARTALPPEHLSWKNCLEIRDVESSMARICMEYLRFKGWQQDNKIAVSSNITGYDTSKKSGTIDGDSKECHQMPSLWAYASEHWASHARDGTLDTQDPAMSALWTLSDTKHELFPLWFPLAWKAKRPNEKIHDEMTNLHLAAFNGHIDVVRQYLDQEQANLEERDASGYTALMWAAENGHSDVVRVLLDHQANPNAKSRRKTCDTPLLAAASKGHEQIVKILLERGAGLNPEDNYKGSALDSAITNGHETLVRLLLDNSAEINPENTASLTGSPWYIASGAGNSLMVRLLLEKGANINHNRGHDGSPLQAASARGHEPVVRLLLEEGADINLKGGRCGSPLQAAAARGHDRVVRLLLEKGADINSDQGEEGTALYAACREGNVSTVMLLIEKGADIHARTSKNGSALHAAALLGDESIVRLLLERGVDVNAEGRWYGTALQAATHFGSSESIVRLLLDHGANVNAWPAGKSDPALLGAARSGQDSIVQLLLENGAHVTACGRQGTALSVASSGGHHSTILLLLKHGADINAQSPGARHASALAAASASGRETTVRLLLENGAHVNVSDDGKSDSALSSAADKGHESVVQLLIDKGANVNAQSNYGLSALSAASKSGRESVVRLLLKYGANVNAEHDRNGFALHEACRSGHESVVRLLLENGADVNAQGGHWGSALQAAAAGGYDSIIRLLLDKGADVHAKGSTRKRAGSLETALTFGVDLSTIQLLLDNGARLDAESPDYEEILIKTLEAGHHATVELLLKSGAPTLSNNGNYNKMLQLASHAGQESVVLLLLDRGIDVNYIGKQYGTALQAAVSGGNDSMVQLLLDKGADINTGNGEHDTALEIAARDGQRSILQSLLKHGPIDQVQGEKALQKALDKDYKEVARLLTQHCIVAPSTS